MGIEMEMRRPSIVATVLWALGLFIIGYAIYNLIVWEGGLEAIGLQDGLLILVAFCTGINAIATGALIDMHNIQIKIRSHKTERKNKR